MGICCGFGKNMNKGMAIEGGLKACAHYGVVICCKNLQKARHELIKYIILLFHQKNQNCHLFFKKHTSVNGRFNYSITY